MPGPNSRMSACAVLQGYCIEQCLPPVRLPGPWPPARLQLKSNHYKHMIRDSELAQGMQVPLSQVRAGGESPSHLRHSATAQCSTAVLCHVPEVASLKSTPLCTQHNASESMLGTAAPPPNALLCCATAAGHDVRRIRRRQLHLGAKRLP